MTEIYKRSKTQWTVQKLSMILASGNKLLTLPFLRFGPLITQRVAKSYKCSGRWQSSFQQFLRSWTQHTPKGPSIPTCLCDRKRHSKPTPRLVPEHISLSHHAQCHSPFRQLTCATHVSHRRRLVV